MTLSKVLLLYEPSMLSSRRKVGLLLAHRAIDRSWRVKTELKRVGATGTR